MQGFGGNYSQVTAQKLNSFEQNVVYRIVGQAVKDDFALAAAFDDSGAFQKAELMGDGGLVEIENAGDVGDAQFADGERGQDLYPRIIGKDGKKAHDPFENIPLRDVIFDETLCAFVEKKHLRHMYFLLYVSSEI